MSETGQDLPEGWHSILLGEIITASTDRVEPENCSEAIYLSLEHIESDTRRILGWGKGSDVTSTKSVFRRGDILYGKLRPYLNKVAVPDFDGICSTDILVFKPSPAILNRFLLFVLNQADFAKYANHNATGINLPRTSFKDVAAYTIGLPPLAEQRRIVAQIEACLAEVNEARERLARIPALLKRFRQSVLAAACSGRLTSDWREGQTDLEPASVLLERIRTERKAREGKKYREPAPPDTSDLPELPEGWEWATVAHLCEVSLGGTPSRNDNSYWDGTIPWLSSGEVANNRIRQSREKITDEGLQNSNAKMLPSNTVLIAMIGEGKTRGQSAILDICACTNQNIAALVPDTNWVYMEYVWKWALGQYESNRSVGRGGNQPALNGQKVRELAVPVPSSDEQLEIVRQIDALFAFADELEKQVRLAARRVEKTTQAVLARAFRGELVPTEAELARQEGRDYDTAQQLLERIRERRVETAPKPRTQRARTPIRLV